MTDERPRYWWGISAVAILAAGIAAGLAYNIGLSQGLAQVPVPAGSVVPHVGGWHGPGGFGFLRASPGEFAHRGTIVARNRPQGGAALEITVPIDANPIHDER